MSRNAFRRVIARTASAILLCVIASFAAQSHAAQSDTTKAPPTIKAPGDHTRTGFILRDVHATLKCEQCHVEGIFKNTPRYCSGCHATGTRVGAKPKPVNHVPTTAECDTCHVSAANFLVRSYKHIGVTGNCITCHNNQSLGVISKPMTHFPTLMPCESCHTNTSTFLSFRMNHSGITSGCYMCHGGPQAGARTYPNVVSYPTATHIATGVSSDCNACHTNFITFLGATFDHSGVTPGTCGTCHMGQSPGTVSINPAIHIPQSSGNNCDYCHTAANTGGYKSFLGSLFHQAPAPVNGAAIPPTYAATCGTSCHSGAYASQGAQGKPAAHIATGTSDCYACHTAANTTNFTTFYGATYDHSVTYSTGFPPGGSGTTANPACSSCHNGATATGKIATHVATTADCITCHTAANTGCGATGSTCSTWLGAAFSHVGTPAPGSNPPMPPYSGTFPAAAPASPTCGTCHLTGVSGAKMKPVGHVVTSQDCIVCHTPASTGCGTAGTCTTFLGALAAQPHTTAFLGAATCVSCHNGVSATGLSADPNHIPIGAAACDQCHAAYDGATSINFGTGATVSAVGIGGASTKYNMKHSVLTGRCDSCHNGAYTGQGIFGAVTKVSNHIPTGIISTAANNDCTTCHTSFTLATVTVVSGTADWLPEVMNHNNDQGGPPNNCVICHLSSATYLSSKIIKKSHNGASLTKDCSTSGCHIPLGRIGAAYSRWN